MEETLLDREGNAIAYLDFADEKTVYLWDGTPVAHIENENCLYSFNGRHIGWYEDGVIWDLSGKKAGFNKTTVPVFAKFEPFKSFKKFKPFKSFTEIAKMKPLKSSNLSRDTLTAFLIKGEQ